MNPYNIIFLTLIVLYIKEENRLQLLHDIIYPDKNWKRVCAEWDGLQTRIFGGRTEE